MLEELVGSKWHNFITRQADTSYPDALVNLSEMRHRASIFFRALGGEAGLVVESATDSEVHARRSIFQRMAGIGKKTQYAWRDEETLRLPESIALFPDKQDNINLYLWLTAISVISVNEGDWIKRNQYRTKKTLDIWPGLQGIYLSLVEAHLKQRPVIEKMPDDEAKQELAICQALTDLTADVALHYAKNPPRPVPLWLHPSPPKMETQMKSAADDPDAPEGESDSSQQPNKKAKKKQAERTEMPDGRDGLMSFRLESLWSWGEFTKVDRTTTEDDDDDAMTTADDMDHISIAQDSNSSAGKVKLDLDLPISQYDDIVLGEGIPVDEWDYKKQVLQKDHGRIIPMKSKDAEECQIPSRLHKQARKVRRQFEMLHPQRHWVSRQNEGSEIDLENYVNFLADRKHGRVQSDVPVYRDLRNQSRDLSCLLLADLSLSTDAYVNNKSRVIDIIRDSLFLFSEALDVTGDNFALHGFSSRNRSHVRFYDIKGFDDKYNDEARGYIQAVKPGYYTRMGAAIRHASSLLEQQATSQKLLLILTDGKPNDLDVYEGRYGIEDTRKAIIEAEQKGLQPFCVTIDEKAQDYLPYLFGANAYILVRHVEELPVKLPLLYLRLTQ